MTTPLISLCHATHERPEAMKACVELWLARSSGKNEFKHILSLSVDVKLRDTLVKRNTLLALAALRKQRSHVREVFSSPSTSVVAWNAAYKVADPLSNILIQVSDDVIPPQNWDQIIVDGFGGANRLHLPRVLGVSSPHDDGGVYSGDGLQVVGIMTRAYADQMGYMLYPEFISISSDTDLTHAAALWGQLIPRPDIKFAHHWTGGDAGADDTYLHQNSSRSVYVGTYVFGDRLGALFPAVRFDGEDVLIARQEDPEGFIKSLRLATPTVAYGHLKIKFKHRRLRGFGNIRHKPFAANTCMAAAMAGDWKLAKERVIPLIRKYHNIPWSDGKFFFHSGSFLFNLCQKQLGETLLLSRKQDLE